MALLLLILGAALPAAAEDDLISARVRLLYVVPRGHVAAGERNDEVWHKAEHVYLHEDLNEHPGLMADVEARLRILDGHRLVAWAQTLRLNGIGTIDRGFGFNDSYFYAGERLASEFSMLRMGMGGDIRLLDSKVLSLWAGLGIEYLRASQEMVWIRMLGYHKLPVENENYTGVAPLFHVESELRIVPTLSLALEARYSPWGIPWRARMWSDSQLLTLDAGLRWRPFPWLEASVGGTYIWVHMVCRGEEADHDQGDNRTDIRLFGPTIALKIRF